MAKSFDKCVANKGKTRTISGMNKRFGLKAGEYMQVCFDAAGMHRGEKHKEMMKEGTKKGENK